MSDINLFEDDWRDCLRAHYIHVIREGDTDNEQSLLTVLELTGFTGEQLATIRAEILDELGLDTLEPEPSIAEPEGAEAVIDEASSTAQAPTTQVQLAPEAEQPAAEELPQEVGQEDQDDEPPPLVQMSLF